MSAPSTNVEKQKNRHIPALLAIGGAAVFGLIIILTNFGSAIDDDDEVDTVPASAVESS